MSAVASVVLEIQSDSMSGMELQLVCVLVSFVIWHKFMRHFCIALDGVMAVLPLVWPTTGLCVKQ